MSDEKPGGNTSDSPTDEAIAQAIEEAKAGDTTTEEGDEHTEQEDADLGAAKEDGEKEEGEDGKEKPPPYDQDPKWKAARAAEKRVNEILEDHDLTNLDELVEKLKDGESLRGILGNRDAEEVISEAQEMAKTRAFWAQKEAEKREADETPEETIGRLKREKHDVESRLTQELQDRDAVEESKQVVREFDSTVTRTVNADSDLSDAEKALLTLSLGVGNEAATVDPTDSKAVKQALSGVIGRVKELLKERDQAVIDKYVAGKSDITSVSKSDTGVSTPNIETEKKPLPKNATLDDVSNAAKKEIIEIIEKAASAQ